MSSTPATLLVRLTLGALWIGCVLQATTLDAASVRIDEDLFLGVWSPQLTRWQKTIPVCISQSADATGGATTYRVTVSSVNGPTNNGFALLNSIGDPVAYRVRWFRSGSKGQGEALQPGVPSRRSYAYASDPACLGDDPPGLEAIVQRRTIDRAPPGIYADTLLVTIAPL